MSSVFSINLPTPPPSSPQSPPPPGGGDAETFDISGGANPVSQAQQAMLDHMMQ